MLRNAKYGPDGLELGHIRITPFPKPPALCLATRCRNPAYLLADKATKPCLPNRRLKMTTTTMMMIVLMLVTMMDRAAPPTLEATNGGG